MVFYKGIGYRMLKRCRWYFILRPYILGNYCFSVHLGLKVSVVPLTLMALRLQKQ